MEELGRIVPRALKRHLGRGNAPLLAAITAIWPRAAGRAIAEQARPAAFSAGTLTLHSCSESWAIQLQGLSSEICAAVNKALGQKLVDHIRVRLARNRDATASALSTTMPRPGLPPAALGCSETVSGIDTGSLGALDPATRETLSRSFAKYFARGGERIN